VCHCERVTRGEIRDALASPVPPADLGGLRRRTRAMNGRCQGFFCAATVSRLFASGAGLAGAVLAGEGRVPVRAEAPLRWISPNAIAAAPPPLGRFVLRSGEFRRLARPEVRQGGRLLARSRPVRLIPGRPAHLGAGWLGRVDPSGGPVRVSAVGV
jgi:hypothetical protein